MRNLLALFAMLVLAFLGCGYFLGWYKISSVPGPDGKETLNIQVSPKKVGNDLENIVEKIENTFEKKTPTTTSHGPQPPLPGAPSSPNVERPQWSFPTSTGDPFRPATQPEDVPFPHLPKQ
jgi:hypothetical protein